MFISTARGFVFAHVPKTGGTALMLSLEAKAARDDILIGDTPKARRRRRRIAGVQASGRLWKHSKLTDIYGLVPDEVIASAFVFTLVRNPWDRVLSYYSWLRVQRFEHVAVALARRLDFDAFLARGEISATFLANPVESYVSDREGRERCGRYLRLEELDRDVAELSARLGLRLAVPPRVNRSDRPADYRLGYTDESAERVARFCAADIAKFGYSFG